MADCFYEMGIYRMKTLQNRIYIRLVYLNLICNYYRRDLFSYVQNQIDLLIGSFDNT